MPNYAWPFVIGKSINNNGQVATKTQKPLEHSYTAHDDQPFTVQELVLLKSVALAKFENKVGKILDGAGF